MAEEPSEDMQQLMDEIDLKVVHEGIERLREGALGLEVWLVCLKDRTQEVVSIPIMAYLDQGEAMQSYGSFTQTLIRHDLDGDWELLLRKTLLETPSV